MKKIRTNINWRKGEALDIVNWLIKMGWRPNLSEAAGWLVRNNISVAFKDCKFKNINREDEINLITAWLKKSIEDYREQGLEKLTYLTTSKFDVVFSNVVNEYIKKYWSSLQKVTHG